MCVQRGPFLKPPRQRLLLQLRQLRLLLQQQQSLHHVRQGECVLLVIRVLVEARFFMLRLLVLLLLVLLVVLNVCIWKLRRLGGSQLPRLSGKLTVVILEHQRLIRSAVG